MEAAKVIEEWSEQISVDHLAQLATYWLIRAELARTVDERQECKKMLHVFCDEIVRRKDNGRSGKGD